MTFKRTGKEENINGHRCAVVEKIGVGTRTLWLDRDRDYVVVRMASINDKGNVGIQWDTEFTQHKDHGWLPTSWKTVWNQVDGSFKESNEVKSVEASINVEIPPSEFDIEFPPGTDVEDERRRK